jgi:hypothetical protein
MHVRDSGLLHALLNIANIEALFWQACTDVKVDHAFTLAPAFAG